MYTTSIGVGVAPLSFRRIRKNIYHLYWRRGGFFALAVGLIQIRKYFIVGLLKLT